MYVIGSYNFVMFFYWCVLCIRLTYPAEQGDYEEPLHVRKTNSDQSIQSDDFKLARGDKMDANSMLTMLKQIRDPIAEYQERRGIPTNK